MPHQTREWTIMFYFASDNPLAPSIISQLKAIKDAGFHPDANVIAHFDPHSLNVPTHTFDVNHIAKLEGRGRSRVGFTANDPFVRTLVLDKLWGDGEEEGRIRREIEVRLNGRDGGAAETALGAGGSAAEDEEDEEPPASGRRQAPRKVKYDPPIPPPALAGELSPRDALAGFLDFCRETYPARHYMLFLLGHGLGVGDDTFLLDEHAGRSVLLLTELGEVLRAFGCDIEDDQEERGRLELVGFHNCSMSSLEVAYELHGAATYMLASQGPAYVGSWPYRQILLRVFNELNSRLHARDLKDAGGLLKKFAAGDGALASLRKRFDAVELPARRRRRGAPEPDPLDTFVLKLNRLLRDEGLCEAVEADGVKLSPETLELRSLHLHQARLDAANMRRLNRLALCDAFPEQVARRPAGDVRELVTDIFHYCLYNSFDFQLAGYSYDLCLCDLDRVTEVTAPLRELSDLLTRALKGEAAAEEAACGCSPPRAAAKPVTQLVLLAHWDAQSFWEENYLDLYDFCYRLRKRCTEVLPGVADAPAGDPLRDIYDACGKVTGVLQRGSEEVRDKVIVRSAFAGPAYQYSHGFSIYFPWAEPIGSNMWNEQYERYRLNKKTAWKTFLETYLETTRRKTNKEEESPGDRPANAGDRTERATTTAKALAFLERVSAHVFDDQGRLGRRGATDPLGSRGATDPLGRRGATDPLGKGCACPIIKNYPQFTRRPEERTELCITEERPVPFSQDYAMDFFKSK